MTAQIGHDVRYGTVGDDALRHFDVLEL